MLKLLRIENTKEYRIEGLTAIQVLRIYKVLESINDCLEIDVMVKCLKMDMDKINQKDI